MTHKLLRAIRLDASDTFVYERAAAAGEWVVPGAFMFWDQNVSQLQARAKQAFRAGFLGLGSFGWSTLAVVVEASEEERESALVSLSTYLMSAHGAPTLEAARAAAGEELAFSESLAQHPPQTLIAVHRSLNVDGEISEQFRTFHSSDAKQATAMPCSAGAFAVVEDDQDAGVETFDMAAAVIASGTTRRAGS